MKTNFGTVQWNRSFLSSIIPRNNAKDAKDLRRRFIAVLVPEGDTRIQYMDIDGTNKVLNFLESCLSGHILSTFRLYRKASKRGTFKELEGEKESKTTTLLKEEVTKIMMRAVVEKHCGEDSDTDTTAMEEEDILCGEDLAEALSMWDWKAWADFHLPAGR